MPPTTARGRGGTRGQGKAASRGGRATNASDKPMDDTSEPEAMLPENTPSTRARGKGVARGRGRGGHRAAVSSDKQAGSGVAASPEVATRPATRKSNQDQHPGEHHHRYTTKRRTKEKIKQDELENAVKLLAERKKSIQEHQSQIKSAAAFETAYRANNRLSESSAIRPDLAEIEKYVEKMAVMTDAHDKADYDSDSLSVPMEDWTRLSDNEAGDPDYEEDIDTNDDFVRQNGVPAVDSEDDFRESGIMGYFNQKARQGSKASNRGILRGAILKEVGSTSGPDIIGELEHEKKKNGGKRKQPSEPLEVNLEPTNEKRAQPQKRTKAQVGPGGLRDGWKPSTPGGNYSPLLVTGLTLVRATLVQD
ncbi:hypothetical protein BDN71DRAFT_1509250 [Pleurotus eryngii]|uniref:Uncharacterized protein n=1 Tax=Pleurotus eryngii TaxID=5323 RepID=A0A9P5ZT37_PLEER|nr:hypothetical protein BDN71DRAFT_1509250 [Pleurotus eryngii]